jgi:diadenosine tetraphosphate (Ap4A) HIT family hydrolase
MSDHSFVLHAQLQADTYVVGHFPLCMLFLCNDANYPWCILVPKRKDISEIHHLSREDRQLLLVESCVLAQCMEQLFKPLKMNVAALGNMVPQLHIHHIARFEADRAWPAPIWGKAPAKNYDTALLDMRLQKLRKLMVESELAFEY